MQSTDRSGSHYTQFTWRFLMTRATKILFAVSLLLLILSYPACQLGDIKVKSEMAKYSAEFVAAHYFDLIFLKWVLPGIWMFGSGLLIAMIAIVLWIFGRKKIKRTSP